MYSVYLRLHSMTSSVYYIIDTILNQVIYIGSTRHFKLRVFQYIVVGNFKHGVVRYMRAWPDWQIRFKVILLLHYSSYDLARQAEMTLIYEKLPPCNLFVPKKVFGVPIDPIYALDVDISKPFHNIPNHIP